MRILGLWTTLLFLHSLNVWAENHIHYGIILDGGSSGTKLKIFKWSRISPVSKVLIEQIENKKFGAVTDFIGNVDNITAYLDEILKYAKGKVLTNQPDCPMHFMATAGMRIVPIEDSVAILNKIEAVLSDKTTNPFAYKPGDVRILSGEEEGVYAWVALNYLRNAFWSNGSRKLAGVLEMGGGSTQIAFLPTSSVLENAYPANIAGDSHMLYAHSYLFYGQNYLPDRINAYLAYKDASQTLENPCLLIGDTTNVTDSSGEKRKVTGTSNPEGCRDIIDTFLRGPTDSVSGIDWCQPKPCAIGQVYQTPIGNKTFYAISSFVFAPHVLKAVDPHGVLNLTLLDLNAEKFCKKNLTEATAGGDFPPKFASSYCLMGLYIPKLLRDSYGFKVNNTVYVTSKIGDTDIDWATGAMLLEIEAITKTPNITSDGVWGTPIYTVLYFACVILCFTNGNC